MVKLVRDVDQHMAEVRRVSPDDERAVMATARRNEELSRRSAEALKGSGLSPHEMDQAVYGARLRGRRAEAIGALIGGAAASIPAIAYMFNDGGAKQGGARPAQTVEMKLAEKARREAEASGSPFVVVKG